MSATVNTSIVQEWANPSRHNIRWARRARVAARLCRSERWVADLGCGMQYLKAFLPRDAVYLPADIVQWTADTEPCDLDAGRLPLRSLEVSDICVMLGVVGHLRDPLFALGSVAPHVEKVLIAFKSTDFTRRARAPLRARAFSLSEMYSILDRAHFDIMDQVQHVQNTMIKARSRLFDATASQRRDERRAAFPMPKRSLADEPRRVLLNLRTLRAALHEI